MQKTLLAIIATACLLPASAQADNRLLLAPESMCIAQSDARAPSASQERAMRCLINYARHQKGLRSMPLNKPLERSARIKTKRVLSCQDYAHRPCNDPLLRSFIVAGYKTPGSSISAQEDLNWGDTDDGDDTARGTMLRWLNSPPHKSAILSRSCEQGVARTAGKLEGDQGVVWVAQFACKY